MNQVLRADADAIIAASIEAVKPDEAVQRALQSFHPGKGKTLLVSTGKAAWQMAYAAVRCLGKVDGGVDVFAVLQNNDAYHALETSGGLIITGATGTNVNDVAVLLIR